MPKISPATTWKSAPCSRQARRVERARRDGRVGVGAVGDAIEHDVAGQRRHGRELARRALGRLAHQLVDALEGSARRLELMPRHHELAHRLQRAYRQHVGRDQGADRHVMVDHLAHADHDDHQGGQELQAARGAGGDIGEVVDAEGGPRRLLDAGLPALLDLGLEAQRLDGGGVGHRLGERRSLGGERLEILVGQPALRAMGRQRHADQHRDGRGRDGTQHRADEESGGEEQRHEGDVDRQHRHLAGEEVAQHVELAQALGDDARRRALEVPVGKLHQMMQRLAAHQRVEPGAGARRQPAARQTQREVEAVDQEHAGAQQHHQRGRVGRGRVADHGVQHQHHEERRGQSEHVDDERGCGKLQDDRPHLRPQRRIPARAFRIGQLLAHHQGARAQRHHLVVGQMPDLAVDDIEHHPLARPAGHDDMRGVSHGQQHEGQRQRREPVGREIEGVRFEATPRAGGQEGGLVEARRRHRRQAAHVRLADRPADLLGDVEQRPHERVDGPASIAGPDRWLEPAILQRGHSSSAPADLLLPL